MFGAIAQTSEVTGRVRDSRSGEALPFVNIIANNQTTGTSADIDGKFVLKSNEPITMLTFSFVGYQKLEYKVDPSVEYHTIRLKRETIQLDEVVILPGENPAHRIIKKVVENKKVNDPEKAISFKYTSYNKLIMTAQMDSALYNNPEKLAKEDSSTIQMANFLKEQHLFMTETVSERKYIPTDRNKETVIAARMSGFKTPVFSMIATEMQSFSFYKELISIMGLNYLNPISKGSTRKYLFVIEDTTYTAANDTVYVITYTPRKGKNFTGLKGVLYINTDGYALQNVIAEPAEAAGESEVSVKIQQKYEKIDGKQWFPVQLNTFMVLGFAGVNEFKMYGIGKSYLKDIELEPELSKSEFNHIEIETTDDAAEKADELLYKHRIDSLTNQEKNTYHLIDSIGKAQHFDRKFKSLFSLASGRLPVGAFDLDLSKLIAFNDYEGFRLGMGLYTNDKISKFFSIGGYGAYGFKDREFKYGGDLNLVFSKDHEVELNLSYTNDLIETGGVKFFGEKPGFTSESYRQIFITRMDKMEKIEARLGFRTFRYWKWHIFGNQQLRISNNEYQYERSLAEEVNQVTNSYYFTEAGVDFRFAYKENFARSLYQTVSLGSKYPVVRGRITKGFDNVLDGEYAYTKFDLKIEKTFTLKLLGKSSFQFTAGYIDGDVPYTKLYNSRGTFKQYNVSVTNTFETMRQNEFISDQYVSFFFSHNFKSLLFKAKKFRPQFEIVGSAGYGSLQKPELHRNIDFKTMEKGYYETGLKINNIIKSGISGIGIGAFYRMGDYQFEETIDNFAFKFTLGMQL
jgi:hypothetical protein